MSAWPRTGGSPRPTAARCSPAISATRDAAIRDLPEGLIDPWLKAISFWDGETPLAVVSAYATHPMSYYGGGAISSDFVGLARAARAKEEPGVFQMYVSGCSGDVTAGKYNDGSPDNRQRLAERMRQAMQQAFAATERTPLEHVDFRCAKLVLPHRDGNQTTEALQKTLADSSQPLMQRALAAMGLSSRLRYPAGHEIDVPAIDFGKAQIVLLPGESLVGYQLLAQQMRPDQFIMAIGYGECSPGYIPTDMPPAKATPRARAGAGWRPRWKAGWPRPCARAGRARGEDAVGLSGVAKLAAALTTPR